MCQIFCGQTQVVQHKVTRVAKKNRLPADLKHFQAFQFLPPPPLKSISAVPIWACQLIITQK